MASASTKKTCAKCNKGAGTAMCHGCEQSFCTKHFIEHRQELSQQMDDIGQEHDVLRRDLTSEQSTHPLLARINQWEQESIAKIQTTAESARADLQQFLNTAKNTLKTSVSRITEELQSSRESDDYTEVDIKKWLDQLQKFRQMLDSPTAVKIHYENDARSVVRLIKLSEQQSSDRFHQVSELRQSDSHVSRDLGTSVSETFVDTCGQIALSEDGFVATCLANDDDWSCVSGIGRYSSGLHHVRFRIEHPGDMFYAFLGIIKSSQRLTKNMTKDASCNGWMNVNHCVRNGKVSRLDLMSISQTGDEVTLVLDCDNRRIQLNHHRTNTTVDMRINPILCPFPWKIIVQLRDRGDSVRILQ